MKLKSLKIWMPATVICLAAACLTTACRSIQHLSDRHQKETVMNIPYVVMNNYFLKNNVVGISYPLITKQEEFSGLFGMAAVMGKDGAPTSIDFSKESVIAIVLPETNVSTEIIPLRLEKGASQGLRMYYTVKRGEEMMSTMRPTLLVKIKNKYREEVMPVEVKQQKEKN